MKGFAETALGQPPIARHAVRRRRGRVFIVAYHNIVPAGESPAGERSLHTDQAAFGDQLDALADLMPIVRLRDVIAGQWNRQGPAAVITFDDAYHGAIAAGGEELARRGLPATVFVAPAFLGGRTFWWDAFADPATGELGDALRNEALDTWAGEDARVRAGMAKAGRPSNPMPAHATAATETLLADAVAGGRFEAASHTWSHCNLAALDREARAREIERGRIWIAAHVQRPVPALALPYGLGAAHAPEASHEDCRAVLLIEGGWATPGDGFEVLPRFNVPRGLSPAGLRLRLAGFLS